MLTDKERFCYLEELKSQEATIGPVVWLEVSGQYKFYLVTKQRRQQKYTYTNVHRCLLSLIQVFEDRGIDKLAIPMIACFYMGS